MFAGKSFFMGLLDSNAKGSTIINYDMNKKELIGSTNTDIPGSCPSSIKKVPNSDLLLYSSSKDVKKDNIHLVNIEGKVVRRYKTQEEGIINIAYAPKEELIFGASRGHFVYVYNINQSNPLYEVKMYEQVWGIENCSRKRCFASGDYDSYFLLYDYDKKSKVCEKKVHEESRGLDCIYWIDEFKDSEKFLLSVRSLLHVFDSRIGDVELTSKEDNNFSGLYMSALVNEGKHKVSGFKSDVNEFFDLRKFSTPFLRVEVDEGVINSTDSISCFGSSYDSSDEEEYCVVLRNGEEMMGTRTFFVDVVDFEGKVIESFQGNGNDSIGAITVVNSEGGNLKMSRMDFLERIEYLRNDLEDLEEKSLIFTVKLLNINISGLRIIMM